MECKLICSDVDGTLLDAERQISDETKIAVRSLVEIPFLLISSRMPQSMRMLQDDLRTIGAPLIAYNGALIVGTDGIVHRSIEIPFTITEKICTHLPSTIELHFSLYHHDEWVVPAMDFWATRETNNTRVTPHVRPLLETLALWQKKNKGAHKIMAMGDAEALDQIEQYIAKNCHDQVNAYRSKATYLEISNKQLDKASALEYLLSVEYPHLGMHHVMAFGDNFNDRTMLEQVGRGVAVANAKPAILSCTPFHTKSNHDHGVAAAIHHYVSN
eukprot:m.214890 g.214890  ORF g.214890 m.214890 type:complete len:272 (+) comp33178_c2_seq2:240-1055(+)